MAKSKEEMRTYYRDWKRNYRLHNREAAAAYERAYRLKHPKPPRKPLSQEAKEEKYKVWRKWYDANKHKRIVKWHKSEAGKAYKQKYQASGKSKISAYRHASKKRVARCLAGKLAFIKVHGRTCILTRSLLTITPEQRLEKQRAYNNKRKAENVQHSIAHRLRNRILTALRVRKLKKNAATTELLGCSVQEYIAYLEALFLPGMNWQNRNLWHIDHTRPLATYDLRTVEGQKAAFHYLNTRPMWGRDNQSKGKRLV